MWTPRKIMATPSLPKDEAPDPSPPSPSLHQPPPEIVTAAEMAESSESTADGFRRRVDDLVSKADQLEQRVNEVSKFYLGKAKKGTSSSTKEKLLCRSGSNNNVSSLGCSGGGSGGSGRKDSVVCSKKMQDCMRQFGTILRQVSQHKWGWPFMEPVDVEALNLDDYYEVIKKPMDFTTIRKQMEANAYRNVREIYADLRLVFTNAMTYNEEKHDVHVMAKTLLEKVEERWLLLLPKVIEAETRQKEEEAQALANRQMAQEAAMSKMAQDTNKELSELNSQLDALRELVVQICRKMSAEEKRKLGAGLSTLSPEDLNKALEIIAQSNPNFQATAEVVDLDMDAQSEITLWRLKFFVKGALELQAKNTASKADDVLKRKVIYDALKTARKRSAKLAP